MSEKFNFSIIQNNLPYRSLTDSVNTSGVVRYGSDNAYPVYLWDLYTDCSSHQAIIDNMVSYICGDAIEGIDPEIFERVAKDFSIFGGFAIQVIYNKLGDIIKRVPVEFMSVRLNADSSKAFVYSNVKCTGTPVEYSTYNPSEEVKTSQIFYYKGSNCKYIYPVPAYSGSLQSIETLIEIQNYHLNSIRNNFNGNIIVKFRNGVPEDEQKKLIEKALTDKFCGSNNGNRLFISYSDSAEADVAIETIDAPNIHERYEQLEKSTIKNVYIGHRVTNPALVGLQPESTGFNSVEYSQSFKIFNKTVISPKQKELINALKEIGLTVSVTPYVIKFEDESGEQ